MLGLPGLLNQTVSLYNQSTPNRYGEDSFGSATTVKARIVPKTRTILQPNGVVVQVDALCYVKPDTSVEVNDKLVFNGINYKVIGKDAGVNKNGSIHHYTLKLSLWK